MYSGHPMPMSTRGTHITTSSLIPVILVHYPALTNRANSSFDNTPSNRAISHNLRFVRGKNFYTKISHCFVLALKC
ncbi:hypothetical protein NSMM_350006 [Nitrosomonas mobilis]|uniref:Uncharacterized protein n=1 Tax=Nitrosomonas mobilis TaxID=51642 RepID=A0A1G5SDC1_9PROT|nr:hypothetical protein NSMM_350006 [Nitrosomonas mobilis]